MVDFLLAKDVIVERDGVWQLAIDLDRVEPGVPENIRQMIEKQFDRLDPEVQQILEVASVAGVDFATAALAAITDLDVFKLEELCDDLAQRFHFLKSNGEHDLPDGTVTSRFTFTHALYHDVLLKRVGPARRAKLHQAIGEWMETAYADRAGDVAAELAMHFEQARDYSRAAQYLQQTAENAIERCANREAVALASRGIELLRKLVQSSERDRRELKLQITLGIAQIAVHGYATPIVGKTFQHARELCRKFGDVPELFPVLWGLWVYNVVREDLATALATAEELLLHSEQQQNSELLALAHWTKEATLVNLGEFPGARRHFEKVLEFFDPRETYAAQRYWHDPGVAGRCFGAWALCCLGYPDQALLRVNEALARAREIRHPHVTSVALFFTAFVYQLRREAAPARGCAEELVLLASKEGLAQWVAFGKIIYGWALARTGTVEAGLNELREGLAACEATNTSISRPHFLSMLAEAQFEAGKTSEALATLDRALKVSKDASDRYYESELYRFKGELLLHEVQPRSRRTKQIAADAEACFWHAIRIARDQEAKWFELRAALSLSCMERGANVQEFLAPVYEWFSEGFETPDLQAARLFLESQHPST